VNIDALGCVGESPSSFCAMLTAAFDQRLAATACLGGLTRISQMPRNTLAELTGTVQALTAGNQSSRQASEFPFDLDEALAAIAPRGVFIVAPLDDADYSADGVKQAVASASAVFKLRGVDQKLRAVYPEKSPAADAQRTDAYQWLDGILKKPAGRSSTQPMN
jgi:hypothetical protein